MSHFLIIRSLQNLIVVKKVVIILNLSIEYITFTYLFFKVIDIIREKNYFTFSMVTYMDFFKRSNYCTQSFKNLILNNKRLKWIFFFFKRSKEF